MEFTREMLEDRLHLLQKKFDGMIKNFVKNVWKIQPKKVKK
jgi:hypothetical protein